MTKQQQAEAAHAKASALDTAGDFAAALAAYAEAERLYAAAGDERGVGRMRTCISICREELSP